VSIPEEPRVRLDSVEKVDRLGFIRMHGIILRLKTYSFFIWRLHTHTNYRSLLFRYFTYLTVMTQSHKILIIHPTAILRHSVIRSRHGTQIPVGQGSLCQQMLKVVEPLPSTVTCNIFLFRNRVVILTTVGRGLSCKLEVPDHFGWSRFFSSHCRISLRFDPADRQLSNRLVVGFLP